MTLARRTTALLLATGLGLGLAGCGSSVPAAKGPVSGSPSSGSPSPTQASTTPSPTPSPTARPLSRFEDRAQVKALRRWTQVYGRAINAGNRSLSTLAPISTSAGLRRFPNNAKSDFGTHFPGALPFTPVRLRVAGATTVVTSCVWAQGWGQNPRTGLPVGKRQIVPADLILKKDGGKWKVDELVGSRTSCSQVPVKGIPW